MTNENKISSKMEQKSKNGKSSTSTLLYCLASKKLKIKFFAARRKNLVLQTFSDHDRFWSGLENFTNRPISLNSVTIESIRSHSYLLYCRTITRHKMKIKLHTLMNSKAFGRWQRYFAFFNSTSLSSLLLLNFMLLLDLDLLYVELKKRIVESRCDKQNVAATSCNATTIFRFSKLIFVTHIVETVSNFKLTKLIN